MLQMGNYQNNHLIINMIFKRLGVNAGKESLPFAIFVVQNKEIWIYENALAHYVQIGSEKLKFSTPNKSFIKGLTNFALVGWLYEVYRNGEFVKDKNGKPITYKNTDQPGTVGFDYKF